MGGGGFSMEPRGDGLDRHVLALAGVARPRVCLLPTASGDQHDLIARFHARFRDLACEPSHASLFRRAGDIEAQLRAQDVVYVAGGSLRNMLAIWRAHGVERLLVDLWRDGTLLCGLSAGSMCWFEHAITCSTGAPRPAAGLGLLAGSNCVHYDGEPAATAALPRGHPPRAPGRLGGGGRRRPALRGRADGRGRHRAARRARLPRGAPPGRPRRRAADRAARPRGSRRRARAAAVRDRGVAAGTPGAGPRPAARPATRVGTGLTPARTCLDRGRCASPWMSSPTRPSSRER